MPTLPLPPAPAGGPNLSVRQAHPHPSTDLSGMRRFPQRLVLTHYLTIDLKLASNVRLPGFVSKFVEVELDKILAVG